MKNGEWVIGKTHNGREFPYKITAKMVSNVKSVTQEEANQLISDAKYFYVKYREHIAIIDKLKKELTVAEETVKLLQVGD